MLLQIKMLLYVFAASNLLKAKAMQLHQVISNDKQTVEMNKEKIEDLRGERLDQLHKLQQVV